MIMTPEMAAEILLAAFVAIITGALQAPVVEPLVNLGKWIAGKFGYESMGNTFLLIIAGIVTLLTWLARGTGTEANLNTVFEWLTMVIPVALTLLTTLFGSKVIYNAAVAYAVPVFGYQRATTAQNAKSFAPIHGSMAAED